MKFQEELNIRIRLAKEAARKPESVLADPELFDKLEHFARDNDLNLKTLENEILEDTEFGRTLRCIVCKDVSKAGVPERLFVDRFRALFTFADVQQVVSDLGSIKSIRDKKEFGDSPQTTCATGFGLNRKLVWFRHTTGEGRTQMRTLNSLATCILNCNKMDTQAIIVLSGDFWTTQRKALLPASHCVQIRFVDDIV